MTPTVFLIPGLYNSGPEHWQRLWQRERGFRVVEQRDWETPARPDWVARIEEEASAVEGPIVLAGHSLACTTLAWWSGVTRHAGRVRGVLLVAPSDVEAPTYPSGTTGFGPMPRARLNFPSRVVYSSDDPYVTPERALEFARAWGSEVTRVDGAGHINSASGFGPWPDGLSLLAPWLVP
jgi:predicted alpha/beta hydrolase family esterase